MPAFLHVIRAVSMRRCVASEQAGGAKTFLLASGFTKL
jgi:hypothetical protein